MVVFQRKGHCNTWVLSYWVNILNVMSIKIPFKYICQVYLKISLIPMKQSYHFLFILFAEFN